MIHMGYTRCFELCRLVIDLAFSVYWCVVMCGEELSHVKQYLCKSGAGEGTEKYIYITLGG